jgi:hypothetical protein
MPRDPLVALVYSEQGHWKDAEMLEVVVIEKKQALGEKDGRNASIPRIRRRL